MKVLVITSHRYLGEALLDQQREAFEFDIKFARRLATENFEGYVLPNVSPEEAALYDDVFTISSETYKPADYANILKARDYAESYETKKAQEALDRCDQPWKTGWLKANAIKRATSMLPETPLNENIREMVARRGRILAALFLAHPGGYGQLQLDKNSGTPGPASLIFFHEYVATHGLMPSSDLDVCHLSLDVKPRGAYCYDVGWMNEIVQRPGLWLDVAWWYTLDVIGLFSRDKYACESAEERIRTVPNGLRDWRAYQIKTAEGIDDFDATMLAMKQFGIE